MNVIDILNKIRTEASTTYQDRIPAASVETMEDIRYAMIDDNNIMVANEFMGSLLNKLVKQVVIDKMFTNPLKPLKKGKKPIGDSIEEVYVNFIKGQRPDGVAADLLQRHLPDVKTVYHRMNYENQYAITVDRKRLSKAFASVENLEAFINQIIGTLKNSAELDEFINMKQLIKSAIDNKAMVMVHVDDPSASEAKAKAFIKAVKKTSGMMCFPNTAFNSYLTAQSTDTKPITTFSKLDEQVLILDTSTNVDCNVDVLAAAFNMSVADFNNTKKIVIDAFPDTNVVAALVDDAFIQVYDDFFSIIPFQNPKGPYTNYYLNVDQTQAYSILVNAVAFTTAAVTD